MSGDDAIAALERMGFVALRQKGSHVILKRITAPGASGCVIPRHRSLAPGTLRGALRQANIAIEDFLKHVR